MSKAATNKNERITQLTPATNYDVKRMVFSEPQPGSIPNSTISYKRIPISTLNKDGTIGDLILPTERLFSFGVSENIDPTTKKLNGHVLPLCLYSRDGPTPAEKAWVVTFNNIVDACKNHLLKNREELEQPDLEMNDLKKFNPLYFKKDKGKIVEGAAPTLYAKVIASKKHNKILSMFFDMNGETLDPLTLLGKYCYAKAAIKIESIFIGSKISFQVKLYEVEVEVMDAGGMRPLLVRPIVKTKLIGSSPEENKQVDEDDIPATDGGSLHNSDAEEESVAKPVAKVVKKVIKKVVKK
jgi:hypothetical protein